MSKDPNTIQAIFTPSRCQAGVHAKTRKSALSALAKCLSPDSGLEENQIIEAFLARERLGSTGIGHGIALPHFRTSEIDQPIAACVSLVKPIDYGDEEKQITFLLGLIVPDNNESKTYLEILKIMAALFQENAFIEKIKHESNPQALYETIIEGYESKREAL